jgi:hypothetical protein
MPKTKEILTLVNAKIEPKLKTKIDKFKAKKHWTTSQTIRFILTDYFDAR